tara:strand:- start:504 stop:800 length:297 start_codon:yes stop_codon:yes gene_type:complete
MPKTCFWNLGKWAHKRGNVADDSGVELNEMNSAIPTESKVKPGYSSKSTKGMLDQLRGACTHAQRSPGPLDPACHLLAYVLCLEQTRDAVFSLIVLES